MNYQIEIEHNGRKASTLRDILPATGSLKMLIVGENPVEKSIEAGHYYQGPNGTELWRLLSEKHILTVPQAEFEDDHLISHGFGMTDIVKVTDEPNQKPTDEEFQQGLPFFLHLLDNHQPKIVFFVYKGVLKKILEAKFHVHLSRIPSGFYSGPKAVFPYRIFVLGMGRDPSQRELALRDRALSQLVGELRKFEQKEAC